MPEQKKYDEPFDDNKELFQEIVTEADLDKNVNVKLVTNNRLKRVGKVSKASDLVKYLDNIDVLIEINEAVFEMLDEQQKRIIAEDLVSYISYYLEKDKIKVEPNPDFMTWSGLLDKYGVEEYQRTLSSIKAAIEQLKEEKRI